MSEQERNILSVQENGQNKYTNKIYNGAMISALVGGTIIGSILLAERYTRKEKPDLPEKTEYTQARLDRPASGTTVFVKPSK